MRTPRVVKAANVKHQRARATASRAKERSRCARSAACASSTAAFWATADRLNAIEAPGAATPHQGRQKRKCYSPSRRISEKAEVAIDSR